MAEDPKPKGFRNAVRRLTEAHEAALSESINLTRPIINSGKSELVNTLASLLSQLVDYRAGRAWIVDGGSLLDPTGFGEADRYQTEFDRHFRDGLLGWVSESKKLQVVPASQGCFILIPVVSETSNYALIDLALELNVDQLSQPAIELIETLSGCTALALERHHLDEWQRRVKRFLELMPERSNITDSSKLLEAVIGDIRSLLDVDNCSVMLVDHRTQSLKIAAAAGLPDEFRNTIVMLGSGISGKVAQTGRPLFVEDSRHESSFDFPWSDNYEGRSVISIPLTFRGQILGVLSATNRHSNRRLFKSDAALLELFTSHVVVAWQHAVLIEQLKLESSEWSALFDVIGEGVIVLNTQEKLVRANKKAISYFADPTPTSIGKRLSEMLPQFSDDLHRIFTSFAPAPTSRHELYATIDKQQLRLVLRPVLNDSGIVTGFIGHFSQKTNDKTLAGKRPEDRERVQVVLTSILQSVAEARVAPATLLASELDKIALFAEGGLEALKQPDAQQATRAFSPAIPKAPASTDSEKNTSSEKKTILVVDDELEMRDLLKDILELAGYDVIAVGSGPEAVTQLDVNKFNVVITDLGMPLLNGWEVARAAKQRQPNTPVIMVSGWGPEIEHQGQELGVDLVLPKPFHVDYVVESVANILKKNRRGSEF